MKKTFIIIICLALLGYIKCQIKEQTPYVSELFEPLLSISIQANLDTKSQNNIYTMNHHDLYVINRRGFDNQTHKGKAKISKLNAITGREETFFILPPPKYVEIEEKTNPIWIWSISASDSLLFVAVDKEIWVYLFSNFQYEYLKTIDLKGVYYLERENNYLHAFKDTDDGFDWYKINLANNEILYVRKLKLRNHFFLQIGPVQLLSIKNNALYLLQQNEPAIEKYALTGDFLATYSLIIPNWNNIPEIITNKLDSIKNITARNYAFPKYSVFDYNFMLTFFVFPNERFFMMALDRSKSPDGYATPYFVQVIGDTTIVNHYSVGIDENEKFGEKYFPFLMPRAEGNIIYAYSNEYFCQINRKADVLWQNKTQKEFLHEVNLYHRDHDAIEMIETYRFTKDYIPVDSVRFLNYDETTFLFKDVKKEKALFIVSQYPQCSGCIKATLHYFSNNLPDNIDLYCVIADSPSYLTKKENIKEINNYLKIGYTPLFIDSKELDFATKRLITQKANPIVILFDKKKKHVEIISANHIMADSMGTFSRSFIHTINNFIGK